MKYRYKENRSVKTDSNGNLRYVQRSDGTMAVAALTKDGLSTLTEYVDRYHFYRGYTIHRLLDGTVHMVEEEAA